MADADLLRRGTSSKYRGKKQLVQLKERLFANCAGVGYPEKTPEEVWRQIESFAEYSFCKPHGASSALESYHSLFLQTYYPIEVAAATLNDLRRLYSRGLNS